MAIRVCKFGGSSVADAGQLQKVRAIIDLQEERRFVVPSAPGKRNAQDTKVTDLLYQIHATATEDGSIESLFSQLSERFEKIVADLGLDFSVDAPLAEVHDQIRAGAGADYAASRGEYLSGLVLAKLLDRPFVDSAEIVRFDADGNFLGHETQQSVSERLGALDRAVVPGFYGAMPDGTIKTFSRGGSDVTGAIIARGVGASVYENWTDVSGLLMTDPRIVNSPRSIRSLTYRELRELAYMGATVLHEDAIFPVREAGIPVHILNTNKPNAPGTLISRGTNEDEAPANRITGIAGRKDFTILALEKTLMNAEIGFGRKLLGILEKYGVSWEHIPSGIDTLSVVLKDAGMNGRLEELKHEIEHECEPDSIEVYSGIALIATVGRGMSHVPGTAAKLFGALAEADINIRMIDQGSSELNIIVGVENEDFERAVRAIYDGFID